MEDIRKYLNIMRNVNNSQKLILENIDDTTKNIILNMFKKSIDETTSLEGITMNEGTFKANGIISLELRFDITITNNDNQNICNIWFPNNTIELSSSIVDLISRLYSFYSIELTEYIRQNLI
jgi:hypothetical protein